ncbi:hypothetical protein K438DRAFT_1787725 [Mycena galopus ATCC 62051]|nr:hypothetical protein K438DRAFT_1787725 [Mycena galopus ATCC 62051]
MRVQLTKPDEVAIAIARDRARRKQRDRRIGFADKMNVYLARHKDTKECQRLEGVSMQASGVAGYESPLVQLLKTANMDVHVNRHPTGALEKGLGSKVLLSSTRVHVENDIRPEWRGHESTGSPRKAYLCQSDWNPWVGISFDAEHKVFKENVVWKLFLADQAQSKQSDVTLWSRTQSIAQLLEGIFRGCPETKVERVPRQDTCGCAVGLGVGGRKIQTRFVTPASSFAVT